MIRTHSFRIGALFGSLALGAFALLSACATHSETHYSNICTQDCPQIEGLRGRFGD